MHHGEVVRRINTQRRRRRVRQTWLKQTHLYLFEFQAQDMGKNMEKTSWSQVTQPKNIGKDYGFVLSQLTLFALN